MYVYTTSIRTYTYVYIHVYRLSKNAMNLSVTAALVTPVHRTSENDGTKLYIWWIHIKLLEKKQGSKQNQGFHGILATNMEFTNKYLAIMYPLEWKTQYL